MVRNKGQGQTGLNDNRSDNQNDTRQNNKTLGRGASLDDDQRQGARKNLKGASTRKGSPGKDNR